MRGYNIDDYINKKFNHLTLIKNLNKVNKNNSKLALFRCDCGTEKELVFTQVLDGSIKTCGCKQGFSSECQQKKRHKSLLNFYENKTMRNNSTGVTGISKVGNRYRVRIQINKKMLNLGYFNSFEDAKKARKIAEEKYFSKEDNYGK